jgi:hypothetical protein
MELVYLFPFMKQNSYFMVPSTFTISWWARQHLTAEETLFTLDVSEVHIKGLTSSEQKILCNDTFFFPGKTTIATLHFLATSIDQHASPTEDKDVRLNMDPSNASDVTPPLPATVSDNCVLHNLKSAKADETAVLFYLWNDSIWPDALVHVQKALDICWRLQLWWVILKKDFIKWIVSHHGVCPSINREVFSVTALKDLDVGQNCLHHSMEALCWERYLVPDLIFGGGQWVIKLSPAMEFRFKGLVAVWRHPQSYITDTWIRAVVKQKRLQIFEWYQEWLNVTLWDPWLSLPTVETHIWATLPGYYMADIELVKCFLTSLYTNPFASNVVLT